MIIKYYLKCDKCNYNFNFYDFRNIYKCFICYQNVCKKCRFKCYPCMPYDKNSFSHCSKCKIDSFEYIKEKLKKIDLSNKEELKKIKYIFYKLYVKSVNESNDIKNFDHIKKLLLLQYFINYYYSI